MRLGQSAGFFWYQTPTTAELAFVDDIAAVPTDDLLAGQRLWATVDSPWVTSVDRNAFREVLRPLRQPDPPVVLCTHLRPAHGTAEQLLDTLESAPDADPFVGPDQGCT